MAALRGLSNSWVEQIAGIERTKKLAHRGLCRIEVAYIVFGWVLGLTLVE
jgi:hypothetical protein